VHTPGRAATGRMHDAPTALWPSYRENYMALGFDGPFAGTRHQFMTYGAARVTIPSNAQYSVPQLRMMLQQVTAITGRMLTAGDWNNL